MAHMCSEFFNLDGTQKFKIFSEIGKGVEVELYMLKDFEGEDYEHITSFYFESLKDVELFSNICKQVIENSKFENI